MNPQTSSKNSLFVFRDADITQIKVKTEKAHQKYNTILDRVLMLKIRLMILTDRYQLSKV